LTAARVRTHVPRGPLSEWIETSWTCDASARPHALERVLPNGSAQLVIALHDEPIRVYDRAGTPRFERRGGGVLGGARSEPVVIDTASQASLLGVQFRPGGAFPFLAGLPAGELHNLHVPLDAIWGRSADELRERLLEAGDHAARFGILERFLERLLRRSSGRRRHPAVVHALGALHRTPHARTIADVADEVGLSSRRFTQLFRDRVGMPPKRYGRVRRFQAALRLIAARARLEWARLALACGYCDQAHMIHEFQELAGLTPATYAALRGEHRNHVPLCPGGALRPPAMEDRRNG
jgi:AraC-like DNA-binding protein